MRLNNKIWVLCLVMLGLFLTIDGLDGSTTPPGKEDDRSTSPPGDENTTKSPQEKEEERKKLVEEEEKLRQKKVKQEKKYKEDLKNIKKRMKNLRKNPNADLSLVWKETIDLKKKEMDDAKKLRKETIAKMKELKKSIKSDVKSVVENLVVPEVTPSVSAEDCQKSTVTEVLSSCQNYFVTIFGGKSDNFEMRMAVLSEIVTQKLTEQDTDLLENELPKMCKIIFVGKTCFNSAQTTCSSKKDVLDEAKTVLSKFKLWNVAEMYCDGDKVKGAQLEIVKSSNMKECSAKGAGAAVVKKIAELTLNLISVQAYITQAIVEEYIKNGKLDNQEDMDKVKKVCLNLKSMTCKIQQLLRKKNANQCNKGAQIMMVESFRKERMPGIDEICVVPNPIKDGMAKKGNVKDSKRQTLVMMGLGHIMSALTADRNKYETCAQMSDTSIVLISHDTFRISGKIDSTTFNSPYLESITLTLIDSTDDSEVSVTFENNLDNLPDKVDAITTKYTNARYRVLNPMVSRFEDESRGIYLIVKKKLVNGTTPVYYFVFRGSLSVINECSGILITGCMDNQGIGTTTTAQSRRRKREANDASTCGQYDSEVSKDESMKEAATETNQNVAASAASDSQFTFQTESSGQDTVRVSASLLLISLLILVFA